MSNDTVSEVELFEGANGDANGDGWLPRLALDHDADRNELYVIVGEEVASMAEGVPSEVFEQIKERLGA